MRKVLTIAEGRPRSERGIALVTVLLFMLVMLTAGLVMTDRVTYTAWEVGQRVREQQAFLVAEAGMNRALWWLNTQYQQPTGLILDTTRAPVRFNGQPLSFVPSNHPPSYTACLSGTTREGVVAGFTGNLGGAQTVGGGTYTITSLRLLAASTECLGGGVADRPEMWELVVTGTFQGVVRTVTAILQRPTSSLWDVGLFAEESITMNSNSRSGSFDSSTGKWDAGSQTWSNACNCEGSVGTNGIEHGVIDVRGNAIVYGNATPGPGAVHDAVTVASAAADAAGVDPSVTGSTMPASAIKVLSDPPAPPSCVLKCNHTFSSGTTILPPGNYGVVTVDAGAILELVPGGAYSFTTLKAVSNSAINLQDASGTVTVTVTERFALSSNAHVNKGGTPDRLEVIVTAETSADRAQPDSQNSSVIFDSNNMFFGTIYAPNAKVLLNSNVQLYGAVIADRLAVNSNSQFYYDRNLRNKNLGDSNRDIIVPFFAADL